MSDLPVHFFTIVLNGQPFVRYHLDVFERLPFRWHWHVIEGVADLKHDTAWSLKHGARITADLHDRGLSNDGTTEYLDSLAALHPERVTLYRPHPRGRFWDGKLEMVNAPLAAIDEECVLWQLDVDEFWTVDQLVLARRLFLDNPGGHAAFFRCHFFVGPRLLISTRHGYGNHDSEWLRAWRYRPGCRWAAHEPPLLAEQLPSGRQRLLTELGAFGHELTESAGLIFQHLAYVLPEQLRFKELYYGYRGALEQWTALQRQQVWPVRLDRFFAWVKDQSLADRVEHHGVEPLVDIDRMMRDHNQQTAMRADLEGIS